MAARSALATASSAAAAVDERASRIPPTRFVPVIDNARRAVQGQVSELATMLHIASTAATLLPPMLGADGPRTYLLAFQTNAEARGTGGIIGAFGVVKTDRGEITVDTLATNRDLEEGASPGVDLGPDYREQYTGYSSTTLIDAGNVVAITESESYARFQDDNSARKDYLESIATTAATKILGGGSTTGILGALGRAADEKRLAAWSAVPAEQDVLASTVLGHVVSETNSPYASVVVLNGGEGKLATTSTALSATSLATAPLHGVNRR